MDTARQTEIARIVTRMHEVFKLVDPAAKAAKLADAGKISHEDAKRVDWRDQIACMLFDSELEAAHATIDEVEQAIKFMTATDAVVSHHAVCRTWDAHEEPGWLIIAPGYRAGPAGDH